jgi:hypothetical protein
VLLYHKVRGGKGEWKEIINGEMIRVTKGVGKKIKLSVQAEISFKITDLNLVLVDQNEVGKQGRLTDGKDKTSRFTVENSTVKQEADGHTVAELFLKVFKLSKHLSFELTIHPKPPGNTVVLHGQSVVFGTHNSGKQRCGTRHFFPFFDLILRLAGARLFSRFWYLLVLPY